MEYYKKALDIFIDLEMYNNSIHTAFNISGLYLSQNKPIKADSVLSMVSTLIEHENNENLFMYLYEKRAKINAQLGNYEEAFNNVEKAYYFEKSFYNDRIDQQVAEMSAKYNLQQKEKEIKEANQKSELKQQQNKILIISIGFILILLALVIIILNYKRKYADSENQILKYKLESKNNQLLSSINDTIVANKVYTEIKTAIRNNKSTEILPILNKNIITGKNWISFYKDFESMYPDFFNTLKSNYPNITKSEQKLSAMLLVNLTTSQMADNLDITPASISKNRNRLRKKLNLKPKSDLHLFMKDLCR
jgi:DNA-binding CsgD family transcriptional regulator